MAFAFLFALSLLAAAVPAARAQTIRPVLTEYASRTAKGSFEIVNPGLFPLTVIVEAKSFTVSDTGDIAYRPLDKNIRVKLSSMSFRVPPQQSFFVFYEATSDDQPAWFVLYASIGGFAQPRAGVNIRLDLPHTVYILSKHSAAKMDIAVTPLGLSPDKSHLSFRVANNGPWFGRALASETTGKGGVSRGTGFPLFPHSSRVIDIACKSVPPSDFRVHLKNFKIDAPLSAPPGESCAI
jgi:hypothetical protein